MFYAILIPFGLKKFWSDFAGKMVLPFEPLTLTFQNLQYYVETPMVMITNLFVVLDTN